MCRHSKGNKIRNKDIKDKVRMTFVVDKIREAKLKWFSHVRTRYIDTLVRRCERLNMVDMRRGR